MVTNRLQIDTKISSYVKQINPLIAKLGNALQKDQVNIKDFVHANRFNIWKIHDILYGSYSRIFLSDASSSSSNDLRKLHDKLVKSTLHINQPKKRFGRLASEIASDFCKGITYYLNDAIDVHPFYHRSESCGSAALTAQQKFAIISTNTIATKKDKQQYVKNCYIERKIFDYIYQHIYKQQDVKHLHELKTMEALYLEYFKDIPNIHLGFLDDYLMPKYVTLIYNETSGKRIEEKYTKLNDHIHATKLVIVTTPTFKIERYEKVQHVEASEQPWLNSI